MKSPKHHAFWMGISLVALAGFWMMTGPIRADDQTRQAMKFKLHYAQGILEGVAMENFDLIATNAANLKRLSQAAGWEVRNTPEYQRHTAEFRQYTENLAKAAQVKNVDAATVAYFQLTVSCVNCHKYLREARVANLNSWSANPAIVKNDSAQTENGRMSKSTRISSGLK